MKVKLYTFLILLCMGSIVQSQVLRPMTARYNNPNVKGNIVYVANNIITSAGISTTEAPPGGTAVNNGNVSANIDIDGTPSTSYVAYGSSWKYLANNTRPANWHTTGFADGAWTTANAEFGYGDGDETTCVPSGGGGTLCVPTGNKWITTYFRKTVNITDPTTHADFTLNVKRDDGIVLYVNGTEVYRNNMPTGAVAHATLATAAAADDGDGVQTATLPISTFVAGNNVLAVEIHQNAASSSDLSFDLELLGNPIKQSTLIPYSTTWKYLDNNTRPAGWETVAYSDAAWATGTAEFGYGDGDEVTCVASGGGGTLCSPTGNKYITTYFRKTINIANATSMAYFILNLVRDDGAVVYVNGVEVARSNMPTGTIAHSTLASSVVNGASETAINTFNIASSYFLNGNNTIAVEVHQEGANSNDITFKMEMIGVLDATFNSSSADLSLPSCSSVLFAGLYWGASQGTDGTNTSWITGETGVKLKLPGSTSYVDLTSTQTDYHNGTLVPGLPHTGFRCFRDITSLINASSPNGTYTVANIASPAGIINAAGGWTIVIAYADPATIVRNLSVFDGSVIMNGGDPALTVPITGFLTPPAGAVSCELGAVVFDGDRVSTDEFSFKQNSDPLVGTYTNLTPNATANLNDMWNSTISHKGVVVTTRNPAHQNTLGYDADIIEVPNAGNAVLGNSQSSASIRFSSPSENYMVHVATTAISQYTPTFNMAKSAVDINGGSFVTGDEVRYELNYQNTGNDASISTIITDNIPVGASYKPGSLIVNGVSKTDAAGDDEAEYDLANNRVIFRIGTGANSSQGGEIATSGTGTVTFEVYTATACSVNACSNVVSNGARVDYIGKISLLDLSDSSGVLSGGCLTPGPVSITLTGSCQPTVDMVLTNICPSVTVTLSNQAFAGYQFFTGLPFSAATVYDPTVPITYSRPIYAFYDGAGSCDDTLLLYVTITACPDIDDDDDGIPDYVELNNPIALQDADVDGIPNWNDNTYPGYVDNNADGYNDNFDPSADSDNDGIPNFRDSNYPGFADANGDYVNDNMDNDRDGVPNHLDRDSDNDGIPDVVESMGVDTDGDGRIDNFSDTDNDNFSQNVDGNNTGVASSGNGLGATDTDGDGVPNYYDLDSDNDGIPDVLEVNGTDANNDGHIDSYTDIDGDGYSDNVDGDVGNDATTENSSNSLLRTGADDNANGRADNYPYKNFDNDTRANPYDLDSDGDGITDVREAGFVDGDSNGMSDGTTGTDGWDDAIDAQPTLTISNNDADANLNYLDIDADNDGIPDNVEGLSTSSYLFPVSIDTDGDGIDDSYDSISGFGGNGNTPNNLDGDGAPDYIDNDTDGDGLDDIYEGNDFDLNAQPDDLVTLTGTDTDGDGLDDRFDANNSSTEGTSQYMGAGGSFTGDGTPGSTTMVQRSSPAYPDRDWRYTPFVLDVSFLQLTGDINRGISNLRWIVTCEKVIDHFDIERSADGTTFTKVAEVKGIDAACQATPFVYSENNTGATGSRMYYRIKAVTVSGNSKRSQIITLNKQTASGISVHPNPASHFVNITCTVAREGLAEVVLIDAAGRSVIRTQQKVYPGTNSFTVQEIDKLARGMYTIVVKAGEEVIRKKLLIEK